jgi:hypothetical protein
MMVRFVDKPEHWRECAKQARAFAVASLKNNSRSEILLMIANDCVRLAELTEQRQKLRSKSSPPSRSR